MDLFLDIEAHNPYDEVGSLWDWLTDEDELRGRVRKISPPPEKGTLGAGWDVLRIALEHSEVAAALASVLVTWIRHRTSDVSVKATSSDGRLVELHASNIKDVDTAAISKFLQDIADNDTEPDESGNQGTTDDGSDDSE